MLLIHFYIIYYQSYFFIFLICATVAIHATCAIFTFLTIKTQITFYTIFTITAIFWSITLFTSQWVSATTTKITFCAIKAYITANTFFAFYHVVVHRQWYKKIINILLLSLNITLMCYIVWQITQVCIAL